MGEKPEVDEYSDQETARRRDAALRNALTSPPKPNVKPKPRKAAVKPKKKPGK
jgi:hypothetical protein